MRYDGKPLFECVQCLMCICRQLPPYGHFTVGLDYVFDYIIDARKVKDDLGETITLPEAVFLSCFENLGEAITSFSPILYDTTEYHLYLILSGSGCSLEEIKAAKVIPEEVAEELVRVLAQYNERKEEKEEQLAEDAS